MVHGVGRPITTQPSLYSPHYNICGINLVLLYCMHYDNQLANCNTRCGSREDTHGDTEMKPSKPRQLSSKATLWLIISVILSTLFSIRYVRTCIVQIVDTEFNRHNAIWGFVW